jgi:prolyl-tRNA synthetase
VPADEEAINAKLLIRGGFISKVMAGVYNYLPLGFRVLNKINKIIREEMDATGAQELHMSVLQSRETWEQTGRWDSAKDVMYQFEDASGKKVGLGWTHEEPLTAVAKHFISSYRDLPKKVYQIQTKFRNEPRARSGLLRGREFLMKDLYSFHADENDLNEYYERVAQAYANIFHRVGVKARRTLASGGLFSKFSDEFQVLNKVGEDPVYYCVDCEYTANKDVVQELNLKDKCPKCDGLMKEGKSIEVGNIFKLGTRFSEAFDLRFTDAEGNQKPVIMASYGIGPGRLLATVVETYHDDDGIIWPEAVAPFKVHLIALDGAKKEADEIYEKILHSGREILYDDRDDKTAGEKFADADLIGCPLRAVVSKKTTTEKKVEIKRRNEESVKIVDLTRFADLL